MRWFCIGIMALTSTAFASAQEPAPPWKAAAAAQVITPKKNVWLAGYAKRTNSTAEQWADVDEYLAELPALLVQVVGNALKDLAPAQLSYTHARAGFAMNRRLPTSKGYENNPYPDGPVDHDVPVLRVEDPKGKL